MESDLSKSQQKIAKLLVYESTEAIIRNLNPQKRKIQCKEYVVRNYQKVAFDQELKTKLEIFERKVRSNMLPLERAAALQKKKVKIFSFDEPDNTRPKKTSLLQKELINFAQGQYLAILQDKEEQLRQKEEAERNEILFSHHCSQKALLDKEKELAEKRRWFYNNW